MCEKEIEMLSPLHLRFTIKNWENVLNRRNYNLNISEFSFNGGKFQMCHMYNEIEGEECFHSLGLLKKFGNCRHPMDVFVQVESGGRGGRIVTDLSGHRYYPNMSKSWSFGFWRKQVHEIRQAVPDFRNQPLTWIIVLKAGFPQAESADIQTKCSIPEGFEMSCMDSLSADYARLIAGASDHDVTFMCAGQSIRAHAGVICARSSVIAAMLRTDMLEGRTRVIRIPGIEPDVFKHFLRYLYCGKVDELNCGVALSLYEIGNQYAVLGLVKRCSQFLLENLTPRNAWEVLVIADLHSNTAIGISRKRFARTIRNWPSKYFVTKNVYRRRSEDAVKEISLVTPNGATRNKDLFPVH